jgi:hypothetical protein
MERNVDSSCQRLLLEKKREYVPTLCKVSPSLFLAFLPRKTRGVSEYEAPLANKLWSSACMTKLVVRYCSCASVRV